MDRANSNEQVFRAANDRLAEEGKEKTVTSFREIYRRQKWKRALKIINKPNTPIYNVSFLGNRLRKWIHKNRRVGRPRSNWTEETIKEIWDYIKKDDDRYKYTRFDNDKEEHIEYIKQHASTHT